MDDSEVQETCLEIFRELNDDDEISPLQEEGEKLINSFVFSIGFLVSSSKCM